MNGCHGVVSVVVVDAFDSALNVAILSIPTFVFSFPVINFVPGFMFMTPIIPTCNQLNFAQ